MHRRSNVTFRHMLYWRWRLDKWHVVSLSRCASLGMTFAGRKHKATIVKLLTDRSPCRSRSPRRAKGV
jgi:hypothetical protein